MRYYVVSVVLFFQTVYCWYANHHSETIFGRKKSDYEGDPIKFYEGLDINEKKKLIKWANKRNKKLDIF